jgi:anti-sigma regulatory factor (Ser/Thr protein kinase)
MMNDTEAAAPVLRSFRSHPSALYEIRQFVRTLADATFLPPRIRDELLVAVTEACANSILHTTSPDVRVSWRVIDECVELEVRDDGVFKRRVPMPELEGGGGHGIPLMMALVDELTIHEGTPNHPGTAVRLLKCQGR